jgi:hypothetical protein
MADEIPFPPPGFTAVLVFDDPTPNTVVLKRVVEFPMAVAAKCTDLKRLRPSPVAPDRPPRGSVGTSAVAR